MAENGFCGSMISDASPIMILDPDGEAKFNCKYVKKVGGDSCIFPILKTGKDDVSNAFRKFFYCAFSVNPTCSTTTFQFPTLAFHSFGSRAVRNDGGKAFLAPQLGNSADTFHIPLSPTKYLQIYITFPILNLFLVILKPQP